MGFFMSLLVGLPIIGPLVAPVVPPTIPPAAEVYFIPHQDDEMFMAGAMKRAVDLGKNVYVVLVTDGSHSSARSVLNGKSDAGHKLKSEFLKRHLVPEKEGYEYISEIKFSALRRQEFNASVHALGVPYDHIYSAQYGDVNEFINKSFRDGKLNEEGAAGVVSNFHHLFGENALYNTLTSSKEKRQHPDHYALSLALAHDKTILRKRFFSEDPTFGTPLVLTKEEQQAKYDALGNYYIWNPSLERFAIGAHSVKKLLDFWKNNKVEYYITDYVQVDY